MTTKEAIEIMNRWFDEYNPHTEDHKAMSVLTALAEENAALKAALKDEHDVAVGFSIRAEKAERITELREWVQRAGDVYDDPRYPRADDQARADLLSILDDYAKEKA
jgi:uncharacterized Rossmann fold enzyme